MKRKFLALAATTTALAIMAVLPAYAGNWKQETTGWWYQNDDMSYPANAWQWIDGNQDGIAESYYFDANGYLLTNTTTPDDYTVNQDGAWTENGIIKQKGVEPGEKAVGPGEEQNQDARTIYEDALKKNASYGSTDANIHMALSMNDGTTSLDMIMDMNMKCKNMNTSDMKVLTTMKLSALGTEVAGTSFYTDGYYYSDTEGEKTKVAMNLDQMMEQLKSSTDVTSIDTSYMKDFTMTMDAQGNRVISYNIDSAAMMSEVNDIYKAVGLDMSTYQISFSDMFGVVTVSPEGFSLGENIKMTMNMQVKGQTLVTTIDADVSFVNPGQPVDFVLPSTDGYTVATQ